MKLKSILILLLAVVITAGAYFINKKDVVASYTTRDTQAPLMSIEGRDLMYKALKSNVSTGEINPQDYMDMKKAVVKHTSLSNSNKSIDHSWVELGPDNIGGRTRAMLPISATEMFAGSIAGGLWKSVNGGNNWNKVPSDFRVIASLEQTENGDIYVGTGSTFEGASGTGSSGFVGEGMFRSTDGGVTFTAVEGTVPNYMSSSDGWGYINALASDPTHDNRVWFASEAGVGYIDNGGEPVFGADGISNNDDGQDIEISTDGSVIITAVRAGGSVKIKISIDGGNSFFTASDNTDLPSNGGRRARVSISPQDPNYLYVAYAKSSGAFGGLWQSTDKGLSWIEIWPGGIELLNCTGDQGNYDLALAVHPTNPEIAFVGGLTVWRGGSAVAEEQISTYFGFGPDHVHPDIHEILFDDDGRMYICCDGGIYSSFNHGESFFPMNKGYNVTTFYKMAQSSAMNQVLGGAQDNGTLYIPADGTFPSSQEALSAGGGDGFSCEISLVTEGDGIAFVTSQFGNLGRVNTNGTSPPAPFFDNNIVVQTSLSDPEGEAGPFNTDIALFEDTEDEDSQQFIEMINPNLYTLFDTIPGDDNLVQITLQTNNKNISFDYTFEANDTLHYWESIFRPSVQTLEALENDPTYWWLPAQPLDSIGEMCVDIIVDSIIETVIGSIETTFFCDTNYVLDTFFVNCVPISFDTTFIDVTTYEYEEDCHDVWFYASDSLFDVREHKLINDPYTSAFVIGFNSGDGIWLTREALNYNVTPTWMKIVENAPSFGAKSLTFSPDGDRLYYTGWGSQVVIEVSNIDQLYTAGANGYQEGDIDNLEHRNIRTGAGGQVTGIAIDKYNPNHMVISVGQYGNVTSGKVQETWNALDDTPTWSNIWFSGSNELKNMPCYDVIIDVTDPTGATIVVGTEFGVFATDNGGDTWAEEVNSPFDTNQSSGLDRVPVFDLRQSMVENKKWWHPLNYGTIYAGTHGRGMFRSDVNQTDVSINNPSDLDNNVFDGLNIFPNPTSETATIEFNLASRQNVKINIYSIQGQLVRTIDKNNLEAGKKTIAISVEDFPQGNYIIHLEAGNSSQTGKFVVIK